MWKMSRVFNATIISIVHLEGHFFQKNSDILFILFYITLKSEQDRLKIS
jgi:hypothetical protein